MEFRYLFTAAAVPAALAALTAVAPPVAAATAETQAVEFVNLDLDHYFITANASEALSIDGGAAGPGWTRTGRSFGVWLNAANAPAGSAAVCRFYSPGANSHFFTASASECAALKAQETAERRQAIELGRVFTGWSFESIAFTAMAPAPVAIARDAGTAAKSGRSCPEGSEDVFRAYNDGFANGRGANHRFVNDDALRTLMDDRGWIAEGVAFCSPLQASGTSAPATPATGSFPELAATWTGNAKWEFEPKPAGADSEARAPLTLTITEAGAISGAGNGCALTGSLAQVDGFRTLYKGTLDAAGCTDARFSVGYALTIERLGTGQLQTHLRNESATAEVHVDALLSTSVPPPVTPPPTTGGANTWVGTVAWIATSKASGNETTLVSVNQPLSLTIDGSTLTGTGFGCTFAGMVQSGSGGALTGTVTATGCDQAVFNGAYAQVGLHPEDGAALEVELERETESGGVSTKVRIRGVLNADGGTPVTPPVVNPPPGPPVPPAGFALPGTWSADVSWSAEIRNGKDPAQFVSGTHALTLTIAADDAITGTGFGCSFTGTAQPASGSTTAFTATLQASGCTDAAFNGAYVDVALHADDSALDIEIEREVEVNDVQTKIRIEGLLHKA